MILLIIPLIYSTYLSDPITADTVDKQLDIVVGTSAKIRHQVTNIRFVSDYGAAHTQLEGATIRAADIDDYSIGSVFMNAELKVVWFKGITKLRVSKSLFFAACEAESLLQITRTRQDAG